MKHKKNTIIIIGLVIFLFIVSLIIWKGLGENLPSMLTDNIDFQSNPDKSMESAFAYLLKNDDKAEIISGVNTDEKVISLVFQGLSDSSTNESVIELLDKSKQKADFFISGTLMAEYSNFIRQVDNKGHKLGSNSLLGSKEMQDLSQEELVEDFVRANDIFYKKIHRKTDILMCNSTVYTDELLEAAYASGMKKLVKPNVFLNYQSFKNYDEVLGYIKGLKKGSIVSIKMDGVLEADEYDDKKVEDGFYTREKTKQIEEEGVKESEQEIEKELSAEERLINMVEWLIKALDETGYRIVFVDDLESYGHDSFDDGLIIEYASNGIKKPSIISKAKDFSKEYKDELRKSNKGRKAKELNTIYTTEKSLSYSFYGISNKEVLEKVLYNLDILDAKATFYISKKDAIDYPDIIKTIDEKGHELGIALMESQDKDFYSALDSILFVQRQLGEYTDQKPSLVRFPYDMDLEDEVLEAISSAGCKLVWQDLSIASSKVGRDGTMQEVLDNIFGQGNIVARRGYIIYFRMDYYNKIDLVPDSMLQIAKDRIDLITYDDGIDNNASNYLIKSIGSLLKGDKVYDYPLKDEDILLAARNAIYPGHLDSYSEEEKFNFIKNRYIGNPDISSINTLPGFTEEELELIDKTGVFTDEKVIFLTFDDWSSDKPINHLLYVLDKHDVKGNFFIRTNYMLNNPNILRAIAEEGHDVGSHSDEHLPFAIREGSITGQEDEGEDDTNAVYYSLSEEEVKIRKEDLLLSYEKLQRVVGDLTINNRPALTKIFRPPTLAMSKVGMEEILDMGFSHIVSGDFSTHDYDESDPEVLADRIINGMTTDGGRTVEIQNGSILVMHMSDFKFNPVTEANVTARALDMAIPILKEKGYRFGRLGDYLR